MNWARKGQGGGRPGQDNLKGRLPPRLIPPNHTKPNPKANGGQLGRERKHLRSRAKELDSERT
jgi:hypothetical protein